jgi:nitrite reductase (NO-forming)
VQAELTDPPMVPRATNRREPAKVIVDLEVKEVTMPIADGAMYTFWTFGGKVPGKFIRIRQGDTVEFTLRNAPDSKMPHNIDLHAVTGPGGGAEATFVAPGQARTFTFKALNPGLYVYHCATAPVPLHVANGMYGLILVEPPEGLEPVDREYYVMQGDFYTTGKYREPGQQNFDMEKAVDERPSYVVFNGADGSLVGDKAITAKVGDRVRLFLGNGGPNLISSFHVIGEIFDKVYSEGGTRYQENVQTTILPAGGSAIVEFKLEVPGTYALVDHSIFRAFNKGAVGQLKVDGFKNPEVFAEKHAEEKVVIPVKTIETPAPGPEQTSAPMPAPEAKPAAAPAPEAAAPQASAPAKPMSQAEQMASGKKLFETNCAGCHQAQGQGMAGVFPPLAKSDYLMADKERSIKVVLKGLSGPVTVNGKTYAGMMPPVTHLNDGEVASILTFVRNSFGNKGPQVTPDEVQAVRAGKSLGGGRGAGK